MRGGGQSLYLEYRLNGQRHRETLGLYLAPGHDTSTRRQNHVTLTAANAIKSRRTIDLICGRAHISRPGGEDGPALDEWLDTYRQRQQ